MNWNLAKVNTSVVSIFVVFYISMLYAFLTVVIPVVYFNVLITLGFGFAIGYVGHLASYFGHFHTKKQRLIFVLSLAVFAQMVQWLGFIALLLFGNEAAFQAGALVAILSEPNTLLFPVVADIYQYGAFNIGAGTDAIPLKDVINIPIWVLECAVIILIPIAHVSRVNFPPYNTVVKRWYPRYVFTDYWELVPTKLELLEAFAAQHVAVFSSLGKGYINRYSSIFVYYHPQSSHAFITVTNHRVQKQTGKASPLIIIENQPIRPEYAKALLAHYPNKKAKLSLKIN